MDEQNYLTPGYFDKLYAGNPDPWQFATSAYERAKYAATLDALPPGRFGRAFEAGCSIGVLTRQLACRSDELIAADVAEAALDQARARCADQTWVTLQRMTLPQEWPEGMFDLMLFSEVLYYLGLDGIIEAAGRTLGGLNQGGTIVLVNWHGDTDGACNGDEAAERFIGACTPRLRVTGHRREDSYRIDVLR